MKICYFDLETQRLFSEVGGRYPEKNAEKLGLSVAGVITNDESIEFFTENEVKELLELLRSADLVIGHNIMRFDYLVLNPYTDFDVPSTLQPNTIDTMLEIDKRVKRFLGLDALVRHTLGVTKTGNAMDMPRLWKEGKHDEVKSYCKNDIEILKKFYLHGKSEKCVKCDIDGKLTEISVEW